MADGRRGSGGGRRRAVRPRGRARPVPARLVEMRVLDGPNLYFTRPAVKLTVDVTGWLELSEDRANALGVRLGLPGASARLERARVRPGHPRSERRRRYVARLGAHVTRTLAAATGTNLAVRSRTGADPAHIVVAFPWRRRGAAEEFGRGVADALALLADQRRSIDRVAADLAARLRRAPPGPGPSVPDPEIPVIAVTGTNGKTTTVRLLAHIARTAGRTVAYSSTDGVYVNEQLVVQGDYSGFGGAERALSHPGVDIAVLETARGGVLLRGIGTLHNDVAVVTNVSADHLGMYGIETLDQLAEVKATVLRITRPEGWAVLNADDPRVLAMRPVARGRPWLYSLDAQHPALRDAAQTRGRGIAPLDGWISVLAPGRDARPLAALEDVPVTLAGISSHYTHNAMAAAAAALGVGLPEEAVVEGLRTFVLDTVRNPGRTNLFELDGRIVVVDYAHNEAGMSGLVETCRGLRPPGGEIWIAACSAGDRTQEIRRGFANLAARGADHFVIAELLQYLRGNTREAVLHGLRAGAAEAGAHDVPAYVDEMTALLAMLEGSSPGDVVAITALSQRYEIFDLLRRMGAREIGPDRVRELARAARGGA